MTVNVLNLPALQVLGFKETDSDSHVKAQPTIASKLWPHCGRPDETVAHPQKTLFIRKLPSHGKSVAIYLDVPLLRCTLCNKTFTAVVPEGDTDRQMTECLAKRDGRYMQDEAADWLKPIVLEFRQIRHAGFMEYYELHCVRSHGRVKGHALNTLLRNLSDDCRKKWK